jgi:NodT family efflux transporter outer membrane factor (OMF) lipoprotein
LNPTRFPAVLARLAAPACLSLLAGCAALAPAPAPVPSASEGPRWQAPLPIAAGVAVVPAAEFWAGFGDPALAPLLQAAQAASPGMAAAAARIERARATQTAATAALLPQASATAAASQGRSGPGLPTSTSASAGVQAGWEIDLFGANAAGRLAASARLRGAEALLADARTAVAAEVTSTLTSLRACEAQSRTTQLDADSRAETARLTDLSARAGFTAPADAALARAGAAQARASATLQRGQCDTLVKSLVELTDLPEPALRAQLAGATARLPQPPAVLPPALPAELLAQRPDLQDAALAVQAAAADRDRAIALQWPQVSLSGSIGGLALRSSGETQRGSTWSIGPLSVDFPLFDGGSRAANAAAARAEYDSARADYQAAMRRAVREVETSLVALQSTAERFDDARSATTDFEAALVATEARQRGGLASLLDLENARRNALAAQSALIELQRERAQAWVTLVRALGAGWRAEAPTAVSSISSTSSAAVPPGARP